MRREFRFRLSSVGRENFLYTIGHIIPIQTERNVGFNETQPVAAIETAALEPETMKRDVSDGPRHGVGQLDFAPRPLLLPIQLPEDLGLQDVTPDNR